LSAALAPSKLAGFVALLVSLGTVAGSTTYHGVMARRPAPRKQAVSSGPNERRRPRHTMAAGMA